MAGRAAPDLRRRRAYREPQRRFVVVCEGKNTEPDYLRAVQATVIEARINIEVISAAGDPMTIAARSINLLKDIVKNRRKRGKSDSYEENDEVWVMFDRDEHDRYAEAVNLCQAKAIKVARSNPCFELWIILHHQDFERPDDRHAVQRHLKALCAEYDPARGKRLDCSKFMNNLDKAEERAERQLTAREHEGDPFGPPSTTVHHLTRAIRHAAERSKRA